MASAMKTASALNTKADKFFGLNKMMENDPVLRPQKTGWLMKKPLEASVFGTMWWKRYFVVKDSFLFWYQSASSDTAEWDTKPKACIPLGSCSIQLDVRDATIFRVVCSDLPELSLMLKAADIFDAQDWVNVLTLARRSTWENAILGSALLEKMHAKGSEIEGEKDRIMKEAQKEAERLRAEQDEQDRLMQQKMEQERLHSDALAAALNMANELKTTKSQAEMKLAEHQSAIEQEKQRRAEIDAKLVKVQAALTELERMFNTKTTDKQGKKFVDNETVLSSVQKLRKYFEEKIQENSKSASTLPNKKVSSAGKS